MAFQKRPEQPKEPKLVIEAPVGNDAKFKALLALSKELDKKHETTNSLMRMGSKVKHRYTGISTGMPTLDEFVLGCGCIPDGRVVEVFGPESSGKTTLTLHIIAQAQRQDKLAAFVDAEHALDPGYAKTLGVDVDNLVISQPNSGEQALQTVEALVKSLCVNLIVVDSVAALVPEAELAGEIGDAHVGLQARMMSQAMRKLVGICAVNKVTVIFINQIREKIGVMFGSPETTTGGRALKFYSSVRLDIRRKEAINYPKDVIVGHQLRIKAVKNKCGTPMRETTVDLYYPGTEFDSGFDVISDTITYASDIGLFEMRGSWYWMDIGNTDPETKKPVGIERLANGLAALKDRLRIEPKVIAMLRKKIAEHSEAERVASAKKAEESI